MKIRFSRKKNDLYKDKIYYIRKMTTLVESYVSLAPNADVADKIQKLSADFRYSDPISHKSLTPNENKLTEMVVFLEEIVRSGDSEAIDSYIADIKRELQLRNSLCANLK